MNFGTKIRTLARIAVSAYTAFCVWQAVVDSFGNKTVSLIWAILIIVFGWLVDFATTWYNNDYTPIASEYTGAMRQAKTGDETGVDISGLDYIEDGDENEEL